MRFKRPGEVLERSSKKARREPTMVVYRGIKPEMKHGSIAISHTGVTNANLTINPIAAGTNVAGRIGSKIKVWNIEGVFNTSTAYTNGLRVDILIPQVAGTAPTHAFNGAVDRDAFTVLKTIFLNSSSYPSTRGYLLNHKLPLGVVCKYDGPLATDIVSNELVVRTSTQANTNVDGYFRIWYTDV